MDGGDFFDMYLRSFDRVWEISPRKLPASTTATVCDL
jgi:hypothetical protein